MTTPRTQLRYLLVPTALTLALWLSSCGPCAKVQRDWEDQWSAQLAAAAIADRPLYSTGTHLRIVYGEHALGAVAAAPLKDADLRPVRRVESLQSSAWGRGEMGLDLGARPVRVRLPQSAGASDELSSEDGSANEEDIESEVAGEQGLVPIVDAEPEDDALIVELLLTLSLRFDVPGYRSRWSWTASAALAAPLHLDATDSGGVDVVLEEGRYLALDPQFPWQQEQVPDEVAEAARELISRALQELIASEDGELLRVLEIPRIELPDQEIAVVPLRVRSDLDERVLMLDLATSLRPAVPLPVVRRAVPDPWSIDVVLPASLVDATLYQQTVFDAEDVRVDGEGAVSEEGRWHPLWRSGTFEDNTWVGDWGLWCFTSAPCGTSNQRSRFTLETEGDRITPRANGEETFEDDGSQNLTTMTGQSLRSLFDFVTAVTRGALTPGGGDLGRVEALVEEGDLRVRWSLDAASRP